MTQKATLQLVVDVEYELNGTSLEDLKHHLNEIIEHAMAEGLVTGNTSAEVENHTTKVSDVTRLLDEDEATKMIGELIDDGEIDIETISRKLARYGLAQPNQFSDEIKERYNDVNVDVTIDYPQPPDFKP